MYYIQRLKDKEGGFVWSNVERTQIDVLAGDLKQDKHRKIKLKIETISTKIVQLRQRKIPNINTNHKL